MNYKTEIGLNGPIYVGLPLRTDDGRLKINSPMDLKRGGLMVNRYNAEIIKQYTSKNINRLVRHVDEVGGFKKYNKTLTVRQKNGIITKWFGSRSRLVDFIEYCKVPGGAVNTVYDIYALTKDEIGIAKYDMYENNTISSLELYTTMIMIDDEGEQTCLG